MSFAIVRPAYKTRLGNLTAKSVLVLLADQVNDLGYGFPSARFIADNTEISLRTVLRVIQVFEAIGLLTKVERADGRGGAALQLTVSKLGSDLSGEFHQAYVAAQGRECRTDTDTGVTVAETVESVATTVESVAATRESVVATVPPHPLIGGPVIDPLRTQTPPNPLASEGECEDLQNIPLTEGQLAHLATIENSGKREYYESFYRDENRRHAEEQAKVAKEQREKAAESSRLQALMPTVEAARSWVMRECGFVEDCRRRGLGAVVDAVLELEAQAGVVPCETGPRMVRAWRKYQANGEWISPRYGPLKFFKLGIWRDERGWAWNTEALRKQAEANTGGRA